MSEETPEPEVKKEETQEPEVTPEPEATAPAPEPASEPPKAEEPQGEEPAAAVPDDVDDGKAFAILSYALSFISLPFFLVPLIMRGNAFALYHAKQSLIIWLAGVVVGVASAILTAICIGPIIGLVGFIFLLVLNIIGLMNAVKGEAKPIPVIGKWGEDWFKGIKKA